METEIIKIDELNIDPQIIQRAGDIIKNGGLVVFPTETVYGLGGNALTQDSAEKIYKAKGRPSDNPLIVHIAELEDMKKLVKEMPEEIYRLAEAFWPGPLTVILEKSDLVPKKTTGGLNTVAIRMPDHDAALAFIKAAGGYVAAPSANSSGRPSPTLASHALEDLDGMVDLILDGGLTGIGIESTIVDLTGEKPTILRPGAITKDMLEKILGEVQQDPDLLNQDTLPPKAPGMKYTHYAPKGELFIVSGDSEKVVEHINELVHTSDKLCGVLATEETKDRYIADSVKSLGARRKEEEIARRMYKLLREFDEEKIEVIYSESFEGSELGQAIMNRLLKAAGHKVLKG